MLIAWKKSPQVTERTAAAMRGANIFVLQFLHNAKKITYKNLYKESISMQAKLAGKG